MAKQRVFLFVTALVCGAVGLLSAPAQAFDCEFYQQCCLELVTAHGYAGVARDDLRPAEDVCYLHEGLSMAPDVQQLFCVQAWEVLSQDGWQDFLAGRIATYPGSCMADPVDLDAVIDPEPEAEE